MDSVQTQAKLQDLRQKRQEFLQQAHADLAAFDEQQRQAKIQFTAQQNHGIGKFDGQIVLLEEMLGLAPGEVTRVSPNTLSPSPSAASAGASPATTASPTGSPEADPPSN